MRTALVSIAAAASFLVTAAVQSAAQASAADEAPIRAIVEGQVTAWNAGDAVAFSKSFAENGSFTNIRGTVFYAFHCGCVTHAEPTRAHIRYSSGRGAGHRRPHTTKPDISKGNT